jgi:hypothetical protein
MKYFSGLGVFILGSPFFLVGVLAGLIFGMFLLGLNAAGELMQWAGEE